MAGKKQLPYTRKTFGFKLHPNVDKLIDDLAAQKTGGDRSRWLTLMVSEQSGTPVDELLVPDDKNQTAMPPSTGEKKASSRKRKSVA
ncbi:Uncharacterised protein [Nocardia otitidiscaviarum]|uniref:Uncharacterized protein n=2 Tax=Nocardia otitidiscaviarum TaxID=1823 RepID=A0A379JM20_9NOCA|nr:Uncharacterised protein [Nocardia otitidiscaviarum]